ncbi:ABC transporter permease [Limibaculum sp. M0105]|uniref:ABC transporter permease n=1 Tax=Thermohalobaculum xanthum TaxID=2753746 RepID=A0A8J7M5J1_9RHOB|nr:ABC transporter permease [Thermohalobaculum xanthum]MBK0398891.1 ABC transporter permease [Thermohalobaculum xanthum]
MMPRLEARAEPSAWMSIASPVIAIGLTLVAGAMLLTALGRDPAEALWVYFVSPFTDAYSRAELVVKAVPLALIGAGLAVSFRANVWNIGAAGQYVAGAMAGGLVALGAPEATGTAWYVLYLAAGAAGGIAWAAIPAFLRTRFNANEILVSLMLTYVAVLLLDWAVRGPWRDPLGFGFPQSRDFTQTFHTPVILEGTRLHAGVLIAVIAAVALTLMMDRTLRGFELRVIGAAPRAGAFAGFSQTGAVWFALLVSGGLAGLAGAIEVSATVHQLQPDISAGYGFVAIIAAFLGRLNPAGALFGALILAVSYIGGENAQILLKLPKNVTGIFQGMLLFFLLGCDTLIRYRIVWGRRLAP